MLIKILFVVISILILVMLFFICKEVNKIKKKVEPGPKRKILEEKEEEERINLVRYLKEKMGDKKLNYKEKEKIIQESLNWLEERWS